MRGGISALWKLCWVSWDREYGALGARSAYNVVSSRAMFGSLARQTIRGRRQRNEAHLADVPQSIFG